MGKTIKYLLLLLFMTCIFNTAKLQEIHATGTIKDRLSHQPLPHATVMITGKGFRHSVLTGEHGRYTFAVPMAGRYTIHTSYLGYRSATLDSVLIDEAHTTIPEVFLELERKEIGSVTVTAKKPFIVVSPDMITLNVAQSAVAAGGSVYDILTMGPGVLEQNDHLTFRG
jgi:hypothetical protein